MTAIMRVQGTGGGRGGWDPLRRLLLLVLAGKCRTMGRQRRPKEILLELVEGEKRGFHPMCLYSKYSVFSGEPNNG